MVTLNVRDPAANINKNITLIVNVTAPDFTPSVVRRRSISLPAAARSR